MGNENIAIVYFANNFNALISSGPHGDFDVGIFILGIPGKFNGQACNRVLKRNNVLPQASGKSNIFLQINEILFWIKSWSLRIISWYNFLT